ncbi:MAG: glycerol kinase [Cyclobacteriaceae bacterium]|jgi:glycerol kinase
MQFQADILGVTVDRPVITESTALGAAFLAGLMAGIWTQEDLRKVRQTDKEFKPKLDSKTRSLLYGTWQKAVERTFNWTKN